MERKQIPAPFSESKKKMLYLQEENITNTYTMKTEEERNNVKEWILAILTVMLIILFGLAVGRCKDNNTTWKYRT
ncbi:MAG: hypothetical protein IKT87_06100 [Bacteroidaceae bacterium]|nr:hypothetical protein [Bacteroidaceae bacterium]